MRLFNSGWASTSVLICPRISVRRTSNIRSRAGLIWRMRPGSQDHDAFDHGGQHGEQLGPILRSSSIFVRSWSVM